MNRMNGMHSSANRQTTGGFTMIELLIAVLIFSIGLLGIAGMQAVALKLTRDAHITATASVYAGEIMERIRLNPEGRKQGAYHDISGTQALPTCITTTDNEGTDHTDPYDTGSCNPEELAELDAYLWMQRLASQLPSGSGSVKYEHDMYTVTVQWQETHDGSATQQTYIVGSFL